MMKSISYFFVVLSFVLFCTTTFAQKSLHDIINIKEKVSNEISSIKKTQPKKMQKQVLLSKTPSISKSILIKSFVFIEGSLLILIGLIFNRRKQIKKRYQLSKLKENIKKLRAEKIGSVFDVRNYKLRKKLVYQPIHYLEQDITRRAKKFAIAKGEIQLALKINMMQSDTR